MKKAENELLSVELSYQILFCTNLKRLKGREDS